MNRLVKLTYVRTNAISKEGGTILLWSLAHVPIRATVERIEEVLQGATVLFPLILIFLPSFNLLQL